MKWRLCFYCKTHLIYESHNNIFCFECNKEFSKELICYGKLRKRDFNKRFHQDKVFLMVS